MFYKWFWFASFFKDVLKLFVKQFSTRLGKLLELWSCVKHKFFISLCNRPPFLLSRPRQMYYRSINLHLRNISIIRPFIDRSACAHVVRSLILYRLDYGNSLLGCLFVTDIQLLQKLSNRDGRLHQRDTIHSRITLVACPTQNWIRCFGTCTQ